MFRQSLTYRIPAAILLWLLAVLVCVADELRQRKPGPYAVNASEPLTVTDPVREQDVTFRVWSPAYEAVFPVVVFSHGGFCPSQNYARILSHWASHGYIVIAPDHVDSPNQVTPPTNEQMQTSVQTRIRDASFALDALEELQREAAMQAYADSGKYAVAGHSFGAGVAMMKVGQIMREQDKGPWGVAHDERFVAAIFFSPPGGGDMMVANAFDGLQGPFMSTGGTRDIGRLDPGDMTPAEWRSQAFLNAPAGDKYALILDGADHYLGGLICNPERGGEPDPDAVEIVRAVTTVFLDAYINDDDEAKRYLQEADLAAATNGRADFRHR